jgi:deoxyribonuclease-4
MPLLGAHTSVAGGLHTAFDRLKAIDGEATQIFTKNDRRWQSTPIEAEAAERFRKAHAEMGHPPIASHDSYLINLASGDPGLAEKSVAAFADELLRCRVLGIPYLITHPGAHLGAGVDEGLRRFTANLDRAMALADTPGVKVLIETTAGQGTSLGATFEEIARILEGSANRDRLGVCFDTCHAFAAGYDIRTPEAYAGTFARFDAVIGIDRLLFFHLNDCKKGLGERIDRHEHIGKGQLGIEAFRNLLNDPRFAAHPMVLETPKENGLELDRMNLATLRGLLPDRAGRRRSGGGATRRKKPSAGQPSENARKARV